MNFLRKTLHLCTGFANYCEVLNAPLADSLKFVTQLFIFLALGLTVALLPRLLEFTDKLAGRLDKELPPLALKDGKVITTVSQPYRSGDDQFLFVLDTTGAVTGPDTNASQGLLLTADSLVFWLKATNSPAAIVQSQRHSLRGFPDGTVNGDYLRRLIHAFLWIGVPLGVILFTVAGVLAALAQAWLFSFAASFLERDLPGALRFRQLLSLAIHAVTPAAIIFTVYTAFQLKDFDLWLLYLIAYGVFLTGATRACRHHASPEEEPIDPD